MKMQSARGHQDEKVAWGLKEAEGFERRERKREKKRKAAPGSGEVITVLQTSDPAAL